MLKYRLTDIKKPTKFYLLYITVYIKHRISPPKKEFFNYRNESTSLHYLQKNTEKTILLYITVTVSRGTYLGIDQNMKRKFVSIVPQTRGRAAYLTQIL